MQSQHTCTSSGFLQKFKSQMVKKFTPVSQLAKPNSHDTVVVLCWKEVKLSLTIIYYHGLWYSFSWQCITDVLLALDSVVARNQKKGHFHQMKLSWSLEKTFYCFGLRDNQQPWSWLLTKFEPVNSKQKQLAKNSHYNENTERKSTSHHDKLKSQGCH